MKIPGALAGRWLYRAGILAMSLAWPVFTSPAFSQHLTLEPGSNLNLGAGTLSLNCGDLTVSGGLSAGSGQIRSVRHLAIDGGNFSLDSGAIFLSGDWNNAGVFSPGTGSVNIVDGCGTTTTALVGDSTFYDFSAATTAGRLLRVTAGSTQAFNHSLTLEGAPSNPLTIRSSRAGTAANFDLLEGGRQRVSYVDVADNNARGGLTLAPGTPASFSSVDSGGNTNWFIEIIQQAVPVDALPVPALLLLAVLLVLTTSSRRPDPTSQRSSP